MNTLYLVATPIGNLEDITHRAVRTLQEVVLIAAEDTRQTRKLLNHYAIQTQVVSYHAHSPGPRLEAVLAALDRGDVALVADAGTPGINDPGYELIQHALARGHRVSPIPGPSAPIAALSASGLPTDSFLYLGYLPRRRELRRTFIQENAHQKHTLIFLETPHRLLRALEDLGAILGDREIVVARELTKLHEEIYRGTIASALRHYRDLGVRGEFTLLVAGDPGPKRWSEQAVREAILATSSAAAMPGDRARQLAEESGWTRREIYQLILEIERTESPGEEK